MTDRLECVWVKQNDKRHVYVDAAYMEHKYPHAVEGNIVMAYVTWWDKKTSIPDTWAVTVRNPVFRGFTRMTNTDTLEDAKNVAQLIASSTLGTFTGVSK